MPVNPKRIPTGMCEKCESINTHTLSWAWLVNDLPNRTIRCMDCGHIGSPHVKPLGSCYISVNKEYLKTLEDRIRRIILHVQYHDNHNRSLALKELSDIRYWLDYMGIELSEIERLKGD